MVREVGLKQDISLAICGHAWHGKSTLLGKAVVEFGMATRKQIEEARRRAREGRDASFVYALLVFRSKDASDEQSEAAKGITILPSIVRFEFPKHRVTVIDTPGQETYANNRFFGMFQADAALLVVDCEEGLMPVTYQVLRILRGFEIPVHGVTLSKMDRVNYEEAPFLRRVDEIRRAFDAHGIPHEQAVFIPTSAYHHERDIVESGEGITKFDKIKWFKGPTLKEFMANLSFDAIRPTKAPLRLLIHGSEVYDHVPGVGKAATGLVETGVLKPDMEIQFESLSAEQGEPVTAKVRSVELTKGHIATPGIPLTEGVPRQLVGIALKSFSEKLHLREMFKGRGVVAGPVDAPPGVAKKMELELTVFEEDARIRLLDQWTMHAHVDRVAVQVDSIHAKRALDSSDWVEGTYDEIAPGEWGRAVVTTVNRPIAIEEAGIIAPLSKVVFREGNKAVAYGRCVKILA